MAWNIPKKDRNRINTEFKKFKKKVPFFELTFQIEDRGENEHANVEEGIGAALWISCNHMDNTLPDNLILFAKGLKAFIWSLRKILNHKSLEADESACHGEFSYTVNSKI